VGKPGEATLPYPRHHVLGIFEERFRRKYLPAYYEEQQVGAFHALVQGNRTVEEYEIRFMELVKYVSYMDNDQ
jgi:hypothetical protein